ncbi:MAG: helix-turn-helix transcriptional regulator [Alphaproteobacteria bacterium]|nr:helix-turn-helix transcriptional regulator [Alphaproteobacteria bacterium]
MAPSALRSTDAADYQDLARPIAVMAKDYPRGVANAPHRHRRGQLLYAATGVIAVTTPAGTWVVPPHRAVWVPAETEHWIRTSTAAALRAAFVDSDTPGLPPRCCVIAVSPLLRELLLRAASLALDYDESGPDGRIMAVILDELRALPVLPLHLPRPADVRLRRVCDAIERDPAQTHTLAGWGRVAGAAPRTLARLFRAQTGMSFGAWRQQARLLAALDRLATGEPVTAVALDLGYQSPSAFTCMFRRALGTSPTRYFGESPR